MSVLRRGLPLLATSFINKSGAIGLSLLPMLLVERHAATADASLVMAVVKAAGPVGVLVGGLLSDRIGAKVVVLAALALQGMGLGLLPAAPTLVFVALFGIAARLGEALFQSPSRLLLTEWVEPAEQYEAMGWLRTANNAGQIVCYGIGALGAGFGLAPLMWFDSATSMVALSLGFRWMREKSEIRRDARAVSDEPRPVSWSPAVLMAVANGAFVLVYELFMVGAAGAYRARYGEDGLGLFSKAMVIDTVLCAALAVWASRFFRQPSLVLPVGAAMTAVGTAIAIHPSDSSLFIYVGAFVLTIGEIVFTSLCSVVLLKLVPGTGRKGAAYASLLVVQDFGRIAGGALAFPLIVHGAAPVAWILGIGAVATVLALVAGRTAERSMREVPAAVVVAST